MLLTFSVSSAFFRANFCFICKISQNYTDLRCLLEIKVLTQPAKGAGSLVAYCSGEKLLTRVGVREKYRAGIKVRAICKGWIG